jgi:Kinesin-like protein
MGKIQFVDLAGSERINKSKVSGDTLKETLHINKSLSALQDVITALETKSDHIPYRNSLLTRLLQPTLGGSESKVTVILTCSPCEDSINETLTTLALGTRIKSVDLCWAFKKNIKSLEVERTLSLLEKERSEKLALLRKLEKLDRDYENFHLAMKEKDLRLASMSVMLKQTEKKHVEQNEILRKELMSLKQRDECRRKSIHIINPSDLEFATKINGCKPDETKRKPILVVSNNDSEKLLKSSSCKQYKILDTSKRFISSSPMSTKKDIVIPKAGKSHTPSRTQKPIIVKSKNLIVKSKN